jgi:hypothetical protein
MATLMNRLYPLDGYYWKHTRREKSEIVYIGYGRWRRKEQWLVRGMGYIVPLDEFNDVEVVFEIVKPYDFIINK